MTKIDDDFCGYLNVDDDLFAYSISNHIVTLLPAQGELEKRNESLERVHSRDIAQPEFLFGVVENHEIAMLRNSKFNSDLLGLNQYVKFGTPLIIKATGNTVDFNNRLTTEWSCFHSISFCGGNINALFDPKVAVKQTAYEFEDDGSRQIKIGPWDDYTHRINLVIKGEKATFTISVLQTGDRNNPEDFESYNLGKLSAFISFSFENDQTFDKIIGYYQIAKSFISILTMQNNIHFDMELKHRNSNNKYFKTAVCKVPDHYENYSKRKGHQVIPISQILDSIPNLIEKIENSEIDSLFALLPDNNKETLQISITNVQDLCTALEVAYNWSERKKEKDALIEELKKR